MRKHDQPVFLGCLGFAAAALLIVLGIGASLLSSFHEESKTCTVTGKESVAKGEQGHEYRVYTQECGTLAVRDNLWRGRFNSADTYGALQEGTTYKMVTLGWRIPFFSVMPNIYTMVEEQ